MRISGFCSFTALGLAIAPTGAFAQRQEPPTARIATVVDTYFGERIADPYRWMEATDGEFKDWARAEDKVTRSELAALPGYPDLLAQTTKGVEAEVRIAQVFRNGDLLYYRRLDTGKAQPSLFVRPVSGGPERKLIDPAALRGATTALGEAVPSPDNRYLAYTLSDGGSEEATLYVLDLQTGKQLPEEIDRTRFASIAWSPDSKLVFFNRLKPGGKGNDRFADEAVFRHAPGDDPAHDQAIFTAVGNGSELGRNAFVGLTIPAGSRFAFAIANSGVSAESEVWTAPVASLTDAPKWRRLIRLADKVESLDVTQDAADAWMVTFRDAPRRKLIKIDLDAPDPMAGAKTVMAERADVLKSVSVAKDGVFAAYTGIGSSSLYRLEPGRAPVAIAIPAKNRIRSVATDNRFPGAIVTLEGWTQPRAAFATTPAGLADLKLAPPFPLDLSRLTVTTIEVKTTDGTMIPVDILRRKDVAPGTRGTTLVEAYGAYGSSLDPFFDATLVPFVMHGASYAVAHVRGGGELGEAWHLAGQKATKPNTWHDFIAVVEDLERRGYATRGRVAGMGVSAGGIMIGRTVTERPDLLAAALMWAPMINTLRFETTEGGPANVAEFGTIKTKEGYAALREMDAYSHVVDGTRYPAVLLTGGMNDHRVPVWMAAEMAARLRTASSSGQPVRLRVDFEAGHHMMGVAKADAISQAVDSWAFVLAHTGDPAFSPKAYAAR
jgi:prolyl oligopeptidase